MSQGEVSSILLSCNCNHCHALMLSYLPDRATPTRRLRAADSHKLMGNLESLSHVLAISVALEPRAQWRKLGSRRIERGWRTVPLRSLGDVENIDFENPPPCFLLRGVCHRCFVLGVCRSVSNKCRVKGELKCWAKIYWIPAHTDTHVKGDAQTHRSTRVNYKDVTFLGYKYLQMCIHNLGCKRKNMRKV